MENINNGKREWKRLEGYAVLLYARIPIGVLGGAVSPWATGLNRRGFFGADSNCCCSMGA